MTWDLTVPNTGSNMLDTPTIYAAKWAGFETILGFQHWIFSYAASGRHQAGVWPAVVSGSTAAITGAASAAAAGALANDTTLGIHRCFTSSFWWPITLFTHSSALIFRSLDYTFPSNTETIVPFDNKAKDTLNEFNISTYTFTAKAQGYYSIMVRLGITTIGGVLLNLHYKQYNSSGTLLLDDVAYYEALSSDPIYLSVGGSYFMNANDYATISLSNNTSSTVMVSGGLVNNYLNIHRI
jgi:hypothetical protein